MSTLKDRQDTFEAVVAAHRERVARRDAALDAATLAHLAGRADDHGAVYLQGLLDSGMDPERAKVVALEEASRHEEHLKATHLAHAAPDATFGDSMCAACGNSTPHVLSMDGNGETVATCRCGRFKKVAAGAQLE